MTTCIYIRVNGKTIDIGDKNLDIVVLTEYVSGLSHLEKARLIMSLLGRREDFDECIAK